MLSLAVNSIWANQDELNTCIAIGSSGSNLLVESQSKFQAATLLLQPNRRLEIAMEEFLGKGKSSHCSEESTGEEVESHKGKVDKEPIRLTEDPLEWCKENEKHY